MDYLHDLHNKLKSRGHCPTLGLVEAPLRNTPTLSAPFLFPFSPLMPAPPLPAKHRPPAPAVVGDDRAAMS